MVSEPCKANYMHISGTDVTWGTYGPVKCLMPVRQLVSGFFYLDSSCSIIIYFEVFEMYHSGRRIFLILHIAGHRHRGRCYRHRHSGIRQLSPVPEWVP